MFGTRILLFQLFGFRVSIDPSWFVLALLVTWSLATGYFPGILPELTAGVAWVMGALGALGLFASIVVHELAHALVARRQGVEMGGITLFLFGGVAEMTEEPPNARAELLVAVAGPILSVLVAGAAGLAWALGRSAAWPTPILGVLAYLAVINTILVAFNLLPALPLDGGRVLRAMLWAWRGDLRWATRLSAASGSLFGVLLVGLGIVSVLFGNFLGGMWWFLIGLFLSRAAQMSYRQVLIRRALEGETVSHFMHSNPVAVPRSLSVQQLVDDYVYRNPQRIFPVVEDDRLLGCVSLEKIRELAREQWRSTSVVSVLDRCSEQDTVQVDADAMETLTRMSRTRRDRLLVISEGDLVGMLSLRDLLTFFERKRLLEPEHA